MPNEFDYSDNLARSMRYTQDILKSQLEGMIESLITHEDDDDDRDDAVTRLRRQIAAHLHLIRRCNTGLAHRFSKLPANRFFPVNA